MKIKELLAVIDQYLNCHNECINLKRALIRTRKEKTVIRRKLNLEPRVAELLKTWCNWIIRRGGYACNEDQWFFTQELYDEFGKTYTRGNMNYFYVMLEKLRTAGYIETKLGDHGANKHRLTVEL